VRRSWRQVNGRRVELILKKADAGLTCDETEELQQLQASADQRIRAKYPYPSIDLAAIRAAIADPEARIPKPPTVAQSAIGNLQSAIRDRRSP